MGAKMKKDKNSLALLSSKRTRADTRTRADEAFALPSFPEATPMIEMPSQSCTEAATERNVENNLDNLKQMVLQHESMFREQVRELHRLYEVQQSLMAESNGMVRAIDASSGQPSSNSSIVYSSDFPKLGEEQCLSEPAGGLKISFMQAHQGSALKLDHASSSQGPWHAEESVNCKVRGVRRCSIDLERPAEEDVDGEEVESTSIDEATSVKVAFMSDVSQSSRAPLHQSRLSGKDIHLSLSTDWERKVADTDDGEILGNGGKMYVENETGKHVLFQHSGYSELPFSPMVQGKMDCPSRKATVCPPVVLHTDCLTGNKESQLEGDIMSGLQRDNFNGRDGTREKQTPDPEAGSSSSEKNITWHSSDSEFHLATTLTLFPGKRI